MSKVRELGGKLLLSLDEAHVGAGHWEEPEDEEAVDEVAKRMTEEVLGGQIVGLEDSPVEEGFDADSDGDTNDHPCQLLPDGDIDPLEGREVVQGVGPPEDHPHDHEENRTIVKRLVQPQVIVRVLTEVFQALATLLVGVDDPVLRHGPDRGHRVKVDEDANEEPQQHEEQVEFA